MRKLFARHLADAVVEEILRRPGRSSSPAKREATLLFADIRNTAALRDPEAGGGGGVLNAVLPGWRTRQPPAAAR
jgi:hypothetical protein